MNDHKRAVALCICEVTAALLLLATVLVQTVVDLIEMKLKLHL
jgi:low affinity Fe/Cu permease